MFLVDADNALELNNAEPMVLLPWRMALALLLLGVAMGPATTAGDTLLVDRAA